MLDEHLEHEIQQLLLSSQMVSAQPITARASNGDVTLRGKVQSFNEKLAAQQLVTASPYVKKVNNLLVVTSSELVNDQELVNQTKRAFEDADDMSSQCINVNSVAGKVILVGYAATEHEHSVAADIASSMPGVHDVTNLVMVNPSSVIANKVHCHAINEAMKRIIGLDYDDLLLSVVDQTAQITGIVDQLWKKETSEATVRKFKILTVANDIIVRPS